MEALFVLIKFYKLPKEEVIRDIKIILSLNGVVNSEKIILIEALNTMQHNNIDFVDALLCAKKELQNYGLLSFDKDLKKC
ncbi:MAG: twitching motility protein PilT [Sulfurovum sp. FS08-3]|nr:MAG: twitching motility protein PilT [Sulfurovum sp. FS08-3]